MNIDQEKEFEAKTQDCDITEEQIKHYFQKQQQKELEEDTQLTQDLINLAASRGRQIIAVIQTHQNGLIANALWGVQKIK